jgi:hypothetical protein
MTKEKKFILPPVIPGERSEGKESIFIPPIWIPASAGMTKRESIFS